MPSISPPARRPQRLVFYGVSAHARSTGRGLALLTGPDSVQLRFGRGWSEADAEKKGKVQLKPFETDTGQGLQVSGRSSPVQTLRAFAGFPYIYSRPPPPDERPCPAQAVRAFRSGASPKRARIPPLQARIRPYSRPPPRGEKSQQSKKSAQRSAKTAKRSARGRYVNFPNGHSSDGRKTQGKEKSLLKKKIRWLRIIFFLANRRGG